MVSFWPRFYFMEFRTKASSFTSQGFFRRCFWFWQPTIHIRLRKVRRGDWEGQGDDLTKFQFFGGWSIWMEWTYLRNFRLETRKTHCSALLKKCLASKALFLSFRHAKKNDQISNYCFLIDWHTNFGRFFACWHEKKKQDTFIGNLICKDKFFKLIEYHNCL